MQLDASIHIQHERRYDYLLPLLLPMVINERTEERERIKEPTLNELIGLKVRETEEFWPVNSPCDELSSSASSTLTCKTRRRISMRDIEQPDGRLRGGPQYLPFLEDPPKLHENPNTTPLWRYQTPKSSSDSPFTVGLVFPKADQLTADPWDTSLNLEPPFYRRLSTKPPYESGGYTSLPTSISQMALHATAVMPLSHSARFDNANYHRTSQVSPGSGRQVENNPKTMTRSSISPLHSDI